MLTIIGYERAACGCLLGRYIDTASDRELACIEAPADDCPHHRRHDPVTPWGHSGSRPCELAMLQGGFRDDQHQLGSS